MRIYVYVSSYDPLRIYIFEDGLARFASMKYVKNHEVPLLAFNSNPKYFFSDTYVHTVKLVCMHDEAIIEVQLVISVLACNQFSTSKSFFFHYCAMKHENISGKIQWWQE